MTVLEFRNMLKMYPSDAELYFECKPEDDVLHCLELYELKAGVNNNYLIVDFALSD